MNGAQFKAAALEIYQNYWRIKAVNALHRSSSIAAPARLDYTNVPSVGLATLPTASESVAEATEAMNNFIAYRLRRDFLLALIAEFESRLSCRLSSLGLSTDGTLGQLQRRAESALRPALALVQDMDEVRERRNAMVHHGDLAHANYVSASAAVQPRASPYVAAAAIGDNVAPADAYLAYAGDTLVRYSDAIG